MRKPTGNPNGRPRSLTAAQEDRIYATITATKIGRRWKAYAALAQEMRVSVPTLQRAVARRLAQRFAEISANVSRGASKLSPSIVPGESRR